jgi:hypothetical protein
MYKLLCCSSKSRACELDQGGMQIHNYGLFWISKINLLEVFLFLNYFWHFFLCLTWSLLPLNAV